MIHVIGAGGHCKVVLDALLESGIILADICIRDGRADRAGDVILDLVVEVPEIAPTLAGHRFHIAIGSPAARQRLHDIGETAGGLPLTVRHPAARVSRFAAIQAGTLIAAQAVVSPGARVGRSVIINHGAIVDHDCEVADFAHLAPNSTLGGGVKVGLRSMIGAGAIVLPGLSIGDDVTIGAGAVVTRNVAPNETWIGVPASPKAK